MLQNIYYDYVEMFKVLIKLRKLYCADNNMDPATILMVCIVLATVMCSYIFVRTSVMCLLFDNSSTINSMIAQTRFSRCYVYCSPVQITP